MREGGGFDDGPTLEPARNETEAEAEAEFDGDGDGDEKGDGIEAVEGDGSAVDGAESVAVAGDVSLVWLE